jgi:hypothetical protein
MRAHIPAECWPLVRRNFVVVIIKIQQCQPAANILVTIMIFKSYTMDIIIDKEEDNKLDDGDVGGAGRTSI